MRKRILTVLSLAVLSVFVLALPAFAAVDTDATALVTSTAGDIQDTVMAIIPLVLAVVLAVGLALWGIRFVLSKFRVRTTG